MKLGIAVVVGVGVLVLLLVAWSQQPAPFVPPATTPFSPRVTLPLLPTATRTRSLTLATMPPVVTRPTPGLAVDAVLADIPTATTRGAGSALIPTYTDAQETAVVADVTRSAAYDATESVYHRTLEATFVAAQDARDARWEPDDPETRWEPPDAPDDCIGSWWEGC